MHSQSQSVGLWAPAYSDGIPSDSIHRVAAFDVTGCKTSATLSVIFQFIHKAAWQESSKFYSDLRNASSLELTKYYCVSCCSSTVTMLIKLSSYATWSTGKIVASVQLRLNSLFVCLEEILTVTSLWWQYGHSILVYLCTFTFTEITKYTNMGAVFRSRSYTLVFSKWWHQLQLYISTHIFHS